MRTLADILKYSPDQPRDDHGRFGFSLQSALTEDERNAVDQYSGSLSFAVNAYLRDTVSRVTVEELGYQTSDILNIGLGLDSAIARGSITEDSQLYRGIGHLPKEWQNLTPGQVITDKGYISTSTSLRVANNIARGEYLGAEGGGSRSTQQGTTVIINVPKDTNAAIGAADKDIVGHEAEVILPRGSSFTVVAAEKGSLVLNYIKPTAKTTVADIVKYSPDQDRDDHGRWSDGGSGSSNDSVLHQWFTKEENGLRSKREETAIIQGKNGDITKISDANEGQVRISETAMAKIDGAVFTHNHPRSGAPPPSPNDIYVGVSANAAEIRVVTSKETFSVKPPSGGWDKVTGGKEDLLKSIISPKIYFGTLRANSNKEIDTMLHDHWTELSKTYGFTYSREPYTPKLTIRTGKK